MLFRRNGYFKEFKCKTFSYFTLIILSCLVSVCSFDAFRDKKRKYIKCVGLAQTLNGTELDNLNGFERKKVQISSTL